MNQNVGVRTALLGVNVSLLGCLCPGEIGNIPRGVTLIRSLFCVSRSTP